MIKVKEYLDNNLFGQSTSHQNTDGGYVVYGNWQYPKNWRHYKDNGMSFSCN